MAEPADHGRADAQLDEAQRELPAVGLDRHLGAGDPCGERRVERLPVLFGVDPGALRAEGLRIYRSGNGVLLVRRVPVGCITVMAGALSRRG